MPLSVVTAATEQPVSVGEVKLHSRIFTDDQDSIIDSYIKAATAEAQRIVRRQFCSATLRLTLDGFCDPTHSDGWVIWIPQPPLLSVSSITYIDVDGNSTTLGSSLYIVDAVTQPGRVTPAIGETWPDTQSGRINSVSITFLAGYGSASAVPENIRVAIIQMAATWYENRESVVTGTIVAKIPGMARELLQSERWGSYA